MCRLAAVHAPLGDFWKIQKTQTTKDFQVLHFPEHIIIQ